jgi:glycerol-3-phosphate dehydrogenase
MSRTALLGRLDDAYDVIVVGGGITGAGVFSRATAMGYRCLLVEQRDFAWGTSSRSGKLVHGGLRYMAQGQFSTSYHSVREREAMLKSYSGLVHPLSFAIPVPGGNPIMKLGLGFVLALYDAMAGRRSRKFWRGAALNNHLPGLKGLDKGAWTFTDGTTDDSRLVLRILAEGQERGSVAINYVEAKAPMLDAAGAVVGLQVRDVEGGGEYEVRAKAVINATGVWADHLRRAMGQEPRMRPLRGSHILIPKERLPVDLAIALKSPADRRNMYMLPWEGRVLIGTTDLDHREPLGNEPTITPGEGSYMLDALHASFPDAGISESDVISTYSGVRPVVDSGKKDPSKESREESVWVDRGLITITGGKLTTFRRMAHKALHAAAPFLPPSTAVLAVEREIEVAEGVSPRLLGRFGNEAPNVIAGTDQARLDVVPGTHYLWAELDWAAKHEQVVHLDDLLLRRTRIGLLAVEGGVGLLDSIGERLRPLLGWSEPKWAIEADRYRALWRASCSPGLLRA